jgi:hypothetical protein
MEQGEVQVNVLSVRSPGFEETGKAECIVGMKFPNSDRSSKTGRF